VSTIESIDLHVRTYRSALKSTLEVTINSLSSYHLRLNAILHPHGSDQNTIDFSALCYTIPRLPSQIDRTYKVIVGQTPEVFSNSGFTNVVSWPSASSVARRRTSHFHPRKKLLAMFAASVSDIDDLVNLLIAYQVEWNKFHQLLTARYHSLATFKKAVKSGQIIADFQFDPVEWSNFLTALGRMAPLRLRRLYLRSHDLRLQLLAGSWVDYAKTTQYWWDNITSSTSQFHDISHLPIYFVSSNTHSLVNLFTGFCLKSKSHILSYLRSNLPDLFSVWQKITQGDHHLNPNDFLYFASKYLLKDPLFKQAFRHYQQKTGIITIPSSHYLDSKVQIIPVKKILTSAHLDPRLKITRPSKLAQSAALIVNIDYPLGFAAYHIFNKVLETSGKIRGLYVLGKAAVLNGEVGDIQIPRLVFCEHTQNSYIFNNCFNTFFPFTNRQGSILTNQKAVSVLGTFLQNEALIQKYSENNLTVIEMESGPYLGAVTQATYDQPTPKNTIVDLNSAPFDIGIINYTSDTPYSTTRSLGVGNLTLNGVEPTYLSSLAILQRIIHLEENQN
jgi:hypothetical protein